MFRVIRITIYVFLAITTLTALLAIAGLIRMWFFTSDPATGDLPHLKYILITFIAEIIGIVFAYARKGLKYLPHVEEHKLETDTWTFMTKFISSGTTIQIVSNRLSWIQKCEAFVKALKIVASQGGLVEIITPQEISSDVQKNLSEAGVKFYVTRECTPPEARFTLINGNRSGAERLAIARGTHPDHEVTVFDANSGPQMIGMAKDIISKSKGMANAKSLE